MPKIPFWVFMLIAIIYLSSVRVDTMDIDASQYASMSREMLYSHNWLHLLDRGNPYLDKPPFLFWISALSMKIFGVGNFGYKFPSILFGIWTIYATYRLARKLYSDNTARMAALILASCQGMFLMTNDVRCDTILMSWVVTAIWMIQEWVSGGRIAWLLGGFAAAGMGMMTKGPIALMVPVFCFASQWALQRQWKRFFHPAYLAGLVVIALLLLPMSYGLYTQFDLSPQTSVNGKTAVSGLRFFYWSQSFGRITGESPWKNGADISFLMLNMLWSFLPWIFVFIPALLVNIRNIILQKFKLLPGEEWLTTGGFLLTYLALGSSSYQLPHYIFVAFPLAAIVSAQFISRIIQAKATSLKVYRSVLVTLISLVLAIVLLLLLYIFPSGLPAAGLWFCLFVIWLYLAVSKKLTGKLVWLPAAGIIIANVFLTNFVYHQLLTYQVGSQAGKFLKKNCITGKELMVYKVSDPLNSLFFYGESIYPGTDTFSNVLAYPYMLTMQEGLDSLQKHGYQWVILKKGNFFKVSELTGEFLNPTTRFSTLKEYFVVRISKAQ